AMRTFAGLAAQGRDALLAGDAARLASLMNTNFDTRRGIYRLPSWQIDMVETARAAGGRAEVARSGGASVRAGQDEAMFERLRESLAAIGSRTIKLQRTN